MCTILNFVFQFADLATIHESYQFLMKKYVDDQAKDVQFLNLDDIRKNNEKKKNRKKSETDDQENDGLKAVRPNRARLVKVYEISEYFFLPSSYSWSQWKKCPKNRYGQLFL